MSSRIGHLEPAETENLQNPGRRAVQHPSAQLCKQIARFRSCSARDDLPQWKILTVSVRVDATTAGFVPASAETKGAENCLNAFSAYVFNGLLKKQVLEA